jgi:trimeric autotransporter adhesin
MPCRHRLLPLCAAAALLVDASLAAQSPTLLRLRNTAGVDRLVVDSAGGLVVSGKAPNPDPQFAWALYDAQLSWDPTKGAFRAGLSGTHWSDANRGFGSVATGSGTIASGYTSTALGSSTTASGAVSTAMGERSTASGRGSTATGERTVASGHASTAMGYYTEASGWGATATGSNTTASGQSSTAMGSNTKALGDRTTAMGRHASTNGMAGSFVYGDNSTSSDLAADAQNQVSFRAAGGYRLFTTSAMTVGAVLHPGQGSWSTLSDRNRKAAFLRVDGEDILTRILAVPITTWRYITEEDRTVRHIGPMAQDWHAAFGLSSDSLTINSGDFDGVNLAAVQALTTRTDSLLGADVLMAARLRALETENATLHDAVSALSQRNARLEERLERLERAAAPLP